MKADTLSYRVEQLEKAVDELDVKLSKIMENHLPHIQTELMSMQTRINVLTTINIAAVILAIIINRIFQ